MGKQQALKEARQKRDSERLALKGKELSHDDYIQERRHINNEYVAVLEANKPTRHRLSAWQKADNAAFKRWQELRLWDCSDCPQQQEEAKTMDKMPRINPHATALKQDAQLRQQLRWLKQHGFKTARDAQEAGY